MEIAARRSRSRAGAFFSALAVLTAVAFADGGYFRESWLWITLALCSLAGIGLLLRERIELGRLDLVTVGALGCLVGWTAVSATWSSAPAESLRDAERGLIYVAALLAFLLLVERENIRGLLAGIVVAVSIVTAYGLGERVLADEGVERDPVEGLLLIEPLGYANALGILAAIGTLLSVSLAAHGSTTLHRVLAAAPSPLLLAALALTESRGAWLALGTGYVALLLVDSRRERALAAALVLALPGAAAVVLAERSSALTDETATPSDVSSAYGRIAAAVVLLGLVAGIASLALPRISVRTRVRPPTIAIAALGGILAAGVVATIRGEPLGLRTDYWRVAWDEFEQNAWLGSGSGTFAEYWQRAGIAAGVRDAHNLYLETLAELGPVGLLLLVAALALPLFAAVHAREHPLTAIAMGAYVAFLVHAGLDWDWEMPAVTLGGLSCGVALLVAARPRRGEILVAPLGRAALTLAVIALAAFAVAARFLVE
jgi:O-Antigen ligase